MELRRRQKCEIWRAGVRAGKRGGAAFWGVLMKMNWLDWVMQFAIVGSLPTQEVEEQCVRDCAGGRDWKLRRAEKGRSKAPLRPRVGAEGSREIEGSGQPRSRF